MIEGNNPCTRDRAGSVQTSLQVSSPGKNQARIKGGQELAPAYPCMPKHVFIGFMAAILGHKCLCRS
jgi:hypothetical protein